MDHLGLADLLYDGLDAGIGVYDTLAGRVLPSLGRSLTFAAEYAVRMEIRMSKACSEELQASWRVAPEDIQVREAAEPEPPAKANTAPMPRPRDPNPNTEVAAQPNNAAPDFPSGDN